MNTCKPWRHAALALAMSTCLLAPAAQAAQAEQFFPVLVYRTGPYGPNGVPWANGYVDYLKMINARDGGINGVKITFEECETAYATDRGVECYERLKGKGPTGATVVQPLSTGVTFALTEKAPKDKIPLITAGYGRSESQDGAVFKWNFPLLGTYWTAADIIMQDIAKREGGTAKLKGKKIALVYHDSPYGKEPIALLEERAKMHGFTLIKLPVTHPGVEQKATWLQVRRDRPDYVLLWGWGVMNSTALKEAIATAYPLDHMYGVWWSGAEPDVKDVGMAAKGYNALAMQYGAGIGKVQNDILKYVYDKNQGTGPRDLVGQVLYNRGLYSAMLGVEGVRRAQEQYGKKPMTGEQVRWGLENINFNDAALKRLGVDGQLRTLRTTCEDHMGSSWARVQTWDGAKWVMAPTWFEADMQLIKPMVRDAAARYAKEHAITPRDCAKEMSGS
ncbi:hypothetical protein GALL_468150 [mine drainage metagenome]|jgi:branched-chain amino acid transport system substrate-binding protein|uniref:Leucine-binding protein domain-containing protein n=1 Tax=mine drainage metagenome TaxID=410659 RepID=A0A1J5Q6J1_9ZZZZ